MKTLTYRDKFRAEHPNGDAELIHIFRCPKNPATGKPVDCLPISGAGACRACWDREIEEVTDDGK